MFTRIRQDVTRTSALLRQARDERYLDRIERPRGTDRIGDLVARYNGVTLYQGYVQRGFEAHRLDGVRATVREVGAERGGPRDVYLTISGPDWTWTVKTVAVFSTRRVRSFAALINSYSAPMPRRPVY